MWPSEGLRKFPLEGPSRNVTIEPRTGLRGSGERVEEEATGGSTDKITGLSMRTEFRPQHPCFLILFVCLFAPKVVTSSCNRSDVGGRDWRVAGAYCSQIKVLIKV